MATTLKFVAWAYAAIALCALIVGAMGLNTDALATAPAILVGMPWSSLLLNALGSTSAPVNFVVLVVAALVNAGILFGLARWLGRTRRQG